MKATDLNETEAKVLEALAESSRGNGHDFGFTDEIPTTVCPKAARGGYVGSLSKKGYLTIHDEVTTQAGTFVQFTLTGKAARALELDAETIEYLAGRGW